MIMIVYFIKAKHLALTYFFSEAHVDLQPNNFRKNTAGQKPVNALCSKLRPAKTVNQTKLGCTNCVNTTDSNTIEPANTLIPFSIVIFILLFNQ